MFDNGSAEEREGVHCCSVVDMYVVQANLAFKNVEMHKGLMEMKCRRNCLERTEFWAA